MQAEKGSEASSTRKEAGRVGYAASLERRKKRG